MERTLPPIIFRGDPAFDSAVPRLTPRTRVGRRDNLRGTDCQSVLSWDGLAIRPTAGRGLSVLAGRRFVGCRAGGVGRAAEAGAAGGHVAVAGTRLVRADPEGI